MIPVYFRIDILYDDDSSEQYLVDSFYRGLSLEKFVDWKAEGSSVKKVVLSCREGKRCYGEIIIKG